MNWEGILGIQLNYGFSNKGDLYFKAFKELEIEGKKLMGVYLIIGEN